MENETGLDIMLDDAIHSIVEASRINWGLLTVITENKKDEALRKEVFEASRALASAFAKLIKAEIIIRGDGNE